MGNKEQIYGRNDMVMLDKHNKIYGSLGIIEPYVFDTKAGETIVMENPKKGKFEDVVTEFRVYGKSTQVTTTGAQLLNPKSFGADINVEGCTIRSNGDGSIFISKEKTASSVVYELNDITDKLVNGKQYAAGNSIINEKTIITQFVIMRDTESLYAPTFTYNDSLDKKVIVRIVLTANDVCKGIISPMVNEGSYAKPYEPYTGGKPSPSIEYPQEIVSVGDKGEIGVSVYGENLYSGGDFLTKLATSPTGYIVAPTQFLNFIKTLKNGTYMIRYDIQTDANDLKKGSNFGKIGFQKNTIFLIEPTNTFTLTDEVRNETNNIILYGYYGKDGLLYNGLFKNIIISAGEYKDPQTLQFATPNGLPGIPVSTGGNYTDSTGKQWVCDEIDLARGKYVQRIAENVWDTVSFTNIGIGKFQNYAIGNYKFKNAAAPSVSNFAIYSQWSNKAGSFAAHGRSFYYHPELEMTVEELNELFNSKAPIKIIGQLDTPIETDLTPEEITAYKALHTNYPVTTILNDENTVMKVTYKQLESKTRVVN